MNIESMKQSARQLEQADGALFEEAACTIFNYHELGMQEYQSAAYLKQQLEALGFTVKAPLAGLDTAFQAEYGSGFPRVAFLAEYDALPGYGPGHDQNGHACGHNFIAANCLGACAVLKKLKDEYGFAGTIIYMGCPAEETRGGKVDMVNAGCFDDIDAAMQIHIAGGHDTRLGQGFLAIDSVEFTYHGLSSHAAGHPEKGINALDACYLMFNGVNALRQHVTPDVRMHGIISNGGLAPNVVPALAQSKWYIRAADRKYLNTLTEKVINCARGGALMAGATVDLRYFENSYDDYKPNPTLVQHFVQALEAIGEQNVHAETEEPSGSSDVGNVSKVCPTAYCSFAANNDDGYECHEEAFLPYCLGEINHFTRLHQAILAQVFLALDIYADPQLQEQIRSDKQKLMEERKNLPPAHLAEAEQTN